MSRTPSPRPDAAAGTEAPASGPPALEVHRVRCAIVVVDVVESVRLMQAHEADVIDRWRRFVGEIRAQVLPQHGGRLVKSLGDAMLLAFTSVRPAAAATFEIQRRMAPYNAGRAPDAAMQLRAGAHVASVVVDELDIYGTGVNTAARVASLAAPGEFVVTVEFCDELLRGVDAEVEDLGDCWVKHLDAALHCWRIAPPRTSATVPAMPRAADAPPQPSAEQAAAESATRGAADVMMARLGVMPLAVMGLQPQEASAGHLIADNLTARLSRSAGLRVISRLSMAALAGRDLVVPEIAQRVGVQYVVAGSVMGRGASRWRVQLEMADGRDGAVLWTHSEDVPPSSLLMPDDDYTAAMADQLVSAMASHQLLRLATNNLPSLQSYSLQLAGLQLMHRAARGDFERARAVLETLVERHPRAPVPRAWMSQWWVLRTTRGLAGSPRDEAVQALSHTRSALQTDPACALALATQGFVECHMLRDLDAAEDSLERAITANPNEPLAWLYRSVVHGFRGQGEEAYRTAATATSLSPLDPQRHYFDALACSAAVTSGRLTECIELARRALQVNRNHLPTLRALTVALAESGDLDAARETGRQLLALAPEFTIRSYIDTAPKGSEATRRRFGEAFRLADLPAG